MYKTKILSLLPDFVLVPDSQFDVSSTKMHAPRTLFIAALAAVANAAPPASGSPKLPGLPKAPGLPKPPTPPTPPKTPGGDEGETAACTYNGTDDGKFDYSAVSLREVGARNTLDWRIWLLHKCKPISFWHDVSFVLINTGRHDDLFKEFILLTTCARSLSTHTRTIPLSSTPS